MCVCVREREREREREIFTHLHILTHSTIDYVSPFTATAVERLLKSGSIMVGKTNLDEFGMGFVQRLYRLFVLVC